MFTIFAKLMKKSLSPMATTLLVSFFNAALFVPLVIYESMPITTEISPVIGGQILLYGLGGILFFVFCYRGLKHVSANTAALFMGVMPISTTLLAMVILNETLSIFDVIGMLCVTTSIYFGSRERKSDPITDEQKNFGFLLSSERGKEPI